MLTLNFGAIGAGRTTPEAAAVDVGWTGKDDFAAGLVEGGKGFDEGKTGGVNLASVGGLKGGEGFFGVIVEPKFGGAGCGLAGVNGFTTGWGFEGGMEVGLAGGFTKGFGGLACGCLGATLFLVNSGGAL